MTDNTLIDLLLEDVQLKKDIEKRQLYVTYAGLYASELSENLDLTSLDLDEKYKTNNPHSWQKFLRFPVIKKFVDGFIDERSERLANKSIGENIKTSDALKIKEQIDNKNKGDDNANITVMFLPQKDYFEL